VGQATAPADSDLRLADDDEAASPRFDVFRLEDSTNLRDDGAQAFLSQTNENESRV
jgi:hypothetical protein